MTFMLGGFAQGLSDGAKTGMALYDTYHTVQQRRAQTKAMEQETDHRQKAFDAAKDLVKGGQDATTAAGGVNTTPTTTVAQPSTTNNGPVAPTTFENVPTPNHLKALPSATSAPSYGASTPMGATANPEMPGSQPATPLGATPAPGPNPPVETAGSTTPVETAGSAIPVEPAPSYNASTPMGATRNPEMGGQQPPVPSATVKAPLIWTGDQGLHRAALGENGLTWSAGQGLRQSTAADWSAAPTPGASALPTGPDMSRVTNRPTGTAIKDWLHGTTTPEQPLTHGRQATAATKPQDLTDQYNTALSPSEEQAYQAWGQQQAATNGGNNPAADTRNYDTRGAWLAGAGINVDRFKKPNHPTFKPPKPERRAGSPVGAALTRALNIG